MNNKIIKFIPLLLVASIIAEIIPSIISDLSISASFWMVGIAAIVFSATIAFIIFYADLKRNNSPSASIGMFVTVIYVIAAFITLIVTKNATLGDYKTIGNLAKFQVTLTGILEALRYMSIISLISIENKSSTTQLFKTGALISAGVLGIVEIASAWASIEVAIYLPKILAVTKEVLQVMIYSYILLQVIESDENPKIEQEIVKTPQNQEPQAQFNNMVISNTPNTFTNTPKFRNPALEEQEARIKAEQMQRAAMTQNPTPQVENTVTLQQNQNNINGNIQQ